MSSLLMLLGRDSDGSVSREILVWLVGWIVLTVCSGDIALGLLVLGLWSDYIHQTIHTAAPDIFPR